MPFIESRAERLSRIGEGVEANLGLSRQVVAALTRRGLQITFVESCTGGAMASSLTDIPGASAVLRDSFVTYSNEAKIELGVSAETIDRYTVYSNQTAVDMAKAGLRRSVGADIAVGVTGSISRVDPSNPNSDPGTVYVAIVGRDENIFTTTISGLSEDRYDAKIKIVGKTFIELLGYIEN